MNRSATEGSVRRFENISFTIYYNRTSCNEHTQTSLQITSYRGSMLHCLHLVVTRLLYQPRYVFLHHTVKCKQQLQTNLTQLKHNTTSHKSNIELCICNMYRCGVLHKHPLMSYCGSNLKDVRVKFISPF